MSTPVIKIHQIQFLAIEHAKYQLIEQSYKQVIDIVVSGRRRALVNHTILESLHTILESLLKLRLFCNNKNNN